jgi:chemotaxis response regulator CheB
MRRRPEASSTGAHTTQAPAYDVVALVASAGGHAAIGALLRTLPADFSVPIVVLLHLAPSAALPFMHLRRPLPLSLRWASAGAVISAGVVLVAPPRSFLELLPGGSCVLSLCERGALDKPIDRLLQSLAESFAHRAIGVVMSGMLSDGADGAFALRSAGGVIIVQSGAEYGSMPQAAILRAGADVTLPVEEIGALLTKLAAGGSVPRELELRAQAKPALH